MRNFGRLLLLAWGLAAASASGAPVAQAPFVEAAQSPAMDSKAMQLSTLLNPVDKTLELGMRGFETGIKVALEKNPDDAAIYDKNPGLLDAIVAAGQPIVKKHLLASIAPHQQRFARFYAEKFSPAELDELLGFYSTATGAKVIAAMYAGLDLTKLSQGMDKDGKLNLTAKTIGEANAAVESKLPDTFDADDWRTIFTFNATPTYAKLVHVLPEFHQLAADLQNVPDPALDAEMEQAIGIAVKTYRKKSDAQGH
jgi:hypothetical protein